MHSEVVSRLVLISLSSVAAFDPFVPVSWADTAVYTIILSWYTLDMSSFH